MLTNDLQKAMFLSENLQAGAVHINGPSVRDEPVIPFGGVKNSGHGREGGHFSMDEMT
ncbi:MAG: aldehyde dehydrogenase family protein, partial [Pseudomonadales bacterium]|nr:aldehyde dehydrogenase family protein [Pseudomonadales bacterium]